MDFGNSSFYGSVHVYRLRDLPILFKKYGSPKFEYRVINLIRNPVDLVWSGYGQFKDLFLYDLNEQYWTLKKVIDHSKTFIHELGYRHNLKIGKLENLSFIGACAVLSSLALDKDAEEKIKPFDKIKFLGSVKMEEVTSNTNCFKNLLEKISNNLPIDNDFISGSLNSGKINKHRKDNKNLSPEERYNGFSSWQKEVFEYFLKKFSLHGYYVKNGYNLDFIR